MEKKRVYQLSALIVVVVSIVYFLIAFFGKETSLTTVTFGTGEGMPSYVSVINGEGDNALDGPMDVYSNGKLIYITDRRNNRVVVFDNDGNFRFFFGKKGKKDGEFQSIYGITGDSSGNIYVADMENKRIAIFDTEGKFVRNFQREYEENSVIKQTESFLKPGAIRIVDEKLYVPEIDTGNIYVLSLKGAELMKINNQGESQILDHPNGLDVDNKGNIYVTDTGNNRVVVFDKNGKFQRDISGAKDKKGALPVFVSPRGIAVTKSGSVYVTDKIAHVVFGFAADGKKRFELGEYGDSIGQFNFPTGLFRGKNDLIYIVDTTNKRVQIFK